ncbi:unnamed protein product [Gadus morhua 'NCC']
MRSKHIGNLSNYKYFVHKLGEKRFCYRLYDVKNISCLLFIDEFKSTFRFTSGSPPEGQSDVSGGHVPPQAPSLDKPLPKTPLSFLEEKSQSHRRLVQADRKDLICSVLLPEPGSFIPNHARSLNSILIPEK